MGKWIWWLLGLGGAGAFVMTARAKAAAINRVVVSVTFKDGYKVSEQALNAVVSAFKNAGAACPGMPKLGELLEAGQVNTSQDGKRQFVTVTYEASYSHSTTGPWRSEVLSCVLKELKKADANVMALAAVRPEAA